MLEYKTSLYKYKINNFFLKIFIDTKQSLGDNNIQPVKPKKFFKSRNVEPEEAIGDPKLCSDKVDYTYPANKKLKSSYGSSKATSPRSSASKKFFPSKRTPSPTPPAKRDDGKPPIVLRICRGKSRLLSDSDESESTLTPSTTVPSSTATSPSARETHQSPGHTRVTRSTSKSLQDSGLSPATAETPSDAFSALLSPEYIPPEKFELERKAMYANLLGPSSPSRDNAPLTEADDSEVKDMELEEPAISTEDIPDEISQKSDDDMEIEVNNSSSGIFSQESQQVINETTDDDKMTPEIDSVSNSTNNEFSVNNLMTEPKKNDITETSSDDESESSQHDLMTEGTSAAMTTASATCTTATMSIEQHRDEIMEKILEKPLESQAPAPVKLVISKKKGSIFKSRAMVADTDGGKKRRALYKHKWSDDRDRDVSSFCTKDDNF